MVETGPGGGGEEGVGPGHGAGGQLGHQTGPGQGGEPHTAEVGGAEVGQLEAQVGEVVGAPALAGREPEAAGAGDVDDQVVVGGVGACRQGRLDVEEADPEQVADAVVRSRRGSTSIHRSGSSTGRLRP